MTSGSRDNERRCCWNGSMVATDDGCRGCSNATPPPLPAEGETERLDVDELERRLDDAERLRYVARVPARALIAEIRRLRASAAAGEVRVEWGVEEPGFPLEHGASVSREAAEREAAFNRTADLECHVVSRTVTTSPWLPVPNDKEQA